MSTCTASPEIPLAVIDACSLTGSVRRHLLTISAGLGLFRPLVSDQILAETQHALPKTLRHSGISDDKKDQYAQQVITLFSNAFPDRCHPAQTEQRRESHPPLPDPDDEHVLDLAIVTGAKVIITENLKDFPKKILSPFGITAMSTDRFLCQSLAVHPGLAAEILDFLRSALEPDPPPSDHILAVIRRVGLKRTATLLAAS